MMLPILQWSGLLICTLVKILCTCKYWKDEGKNCIKFYLLILKRRQLVGDLDIDGNMNWSVSLMWYEGGFVRIGFRYTCGLLCTSLWVKFRDFTAGRWDWKTPLRNIILNYCRSFGGFCAHSKDLFQHSGGNMLPPSRIWLRFMLNYLWRGTVSIVFALRLLW